MDENVKAEYFGVKGKAFANIKVLQNWDVVFSSFWRNEDGSCSLVKHKIYTDKEIQLMGYDFTCNFVQEKARNYDQFFRANGLLEFNFKMNDQVRSTMFALDEICVDIQGKVVGIEEVEDKTMVCVDYGLNTVWVDTKYLYPDISSFED